MTVPERSEIFPLRGDPGRDRQMQATRQSFGGDMGESVRTVLAGGRSPPEIAYALGEIVHNYFRTRGVTLTSYELRRLVADLLALHAGDREAPYAAGPLVQFAREPDDVAAPGAEASEVPSPDPDVSASAPPSALVDRPEDDTALLAGAAEKVRARLGRDPADCARAAVAAAIHTILDEAVPGDGERRQRLAGLILSDLCGLGPIDRLWADRSVHAVFVNGPAAILVERKGVLEPSLATFRDQQHWRQVALRLARVAVTDAAPGLVAVHLRDGSTGLVLFASAAPAGPVAVLRRAPPGESTLARLVALGRLDRRMADLLRIASRSRLNIRIVGGGGSGKTALLAALARDRGDGRVVTLARDRAFDWPSSSKVELVAVPSLPFATLLAAGAQLRPDLFVIDDLQAADRPALEELLACGMCGLVAAGVPQAMAAPASGTIDLTVRLEPAALGLFIVSALEDASGAPLFAYEMGEFHRRTDRPSFARSVQEAGYGEALSSLLR
jgi:pilus assembly protein CpaF